MAVDQPAEQSFRIELRRRRLEARLSLTELGVRACYSKSHLSKVETGRKSASPELARACDAALGAQGELSRLVPPRPVDEAGPAPSEPALAWEWIVTASSNGETGFQAFDRRTMLAGGTAAVTSWVSVRRSALLADAAHPLAVYRNIFAENRRLGLVLDPATVAHNLIPPAGSLHRLAARTRGADQRAVLRLTARYAEYIGWMAQEMGNEQAALFWTDRCVDFARESGDADLVGYTLIRRAEIGMYRGDSATTVEFSIRGRNDSDQPRIKAFGLQREAQGHALAGNERACMRALEEAAETVEQSASAGLDTPLAEPGTTEPPLGPTAMARPLDFVTGWCLQDLGHSAQAADILSAELRRIPNYAHRTRARCAARLALAYASAGEVDKACETIEPILGMAPVLDSATLRTDLRNLQRTLNRWRARPQVRRLAPRLVLALQTSL